MHIRLMAVKQPRARMGAALRHTTMLAASLLALAAIMLHGAAAGTSSSSSGSSSCSRPDGGHFCTSDGLTPFWTDCDGDGRRDWACLDFRSDTPYYGVSASKSSCPFIKDYSSYGSWSSGWSTSSSYCRRAFVAVSSSNSCPSIPGYTALPNAYYLPHDVHHEYYHIQDSHYRKDDGFSDALDVITRSAQECSSNPSCSGFNSDGWLVKAPIVAYDHVQGYCGYKKNAPSNGGRCDLPRPDDGSYCSDDYQVPFSLDCDGDGKRDWACLDSQHHYTPSYSWALSSSFSTCPSDPSYQWWQQPTKCGKAFWGVSGSSCPSQSGFDWWSNSACSASEWHHISEFDHHSRVYSSSSDLISAAADYCRSDSDCIGFDNSGWLAYNSHEYGPVLSPIPWSGSCCYTRKVPPKQPNTWALLPYQYPWPLRCEAGYEYNAIEVGSDVEQRSDDTYCFRIYDSGCEEDHQCCDVGSVSKFELQVDPKYGRGMTSLYITLDGEQKPYEWWSASGSYYGSNFQLLRVYNLNLYQHDIPQDGAELCITIKSGASSLDKLCGGPYCRAAATGGSNYSCCPQRWVEA